MVNHMAVIPTTSSSPATDQPGHQDYTELGKHPELVVCARCGNAVGDTQQHDAWHRYVERVRVGG